MRKVMACGLGTSSNVVQMIIGLAVVLLALPLFAWGGGRLADNPHRPQAHDLPARARSSDVYRPRSDRLTKGLPSCRSIPIAQPRDGGYRPSRYGQRSRHRADRRPSPVAYHRGRSQQKSTYRTEEACYPHGACRSHSHSSRWNHGAPTNRDSVADLARRINILSKDVSSQGRRKLATTINQLPEDPNFHHASQKDLALFSNGVAKLLDGPGDHSGAIRLLNRVALAVIDQKRALLGQWPEQTLAMLIGGLSKGEGKDITGALRLLAQAVIHRKPELDQWKRQHLVMTINGLSKRVRDEINGALNILAQTVSRCRDLDQWNQRDLAVVAKGLSAEKSEQITKALSALARAVSDRKPALGQWTEQHLAMVVSGLSRGEGKEIIRALGVLAQTVSDRKRALGQWTEQHLAMVISGLSKGSGKEVTLCLKILAREVMGRPLARWTEQQLVMMVSGLSKDSGEEITRALSTLARAVLDSRHVLAQWTEQQVAVMVSGLSKGTGAQINEALNAFARVVLVRQRELDQCTDQHLVMVISGLSWGVGEEITKALKILAQSVINRKQQRHRWTAKDLAMLASGLSKEVGDGINRALGVLAQAVLDRQPELGQWTEQQLAMVVNGISKGEGEEITRALSVLAQAVLERQPGLSQWTELHLAMVVCGFSKGTGAEIDRALGALAKAVTDQKSGELNQWTEQHLAMVVSGLSKGTGEAVAKALRTLAKVVIDPQCQLSQWTTQHLVMVVNGLSKGSGKEIIKALNVLAQVVFDRLPELGQWTEKQVAVVVSGLSKVTGSGEEITKALDALAQAVIDRRRELNHWGEQGLAMVTNGLSKVEGVNITECLKVLAQAIGGRDLSDWSEQHLAMVISGITKGSEMAECLQTITLEMSARDLSQWSPQHLAMAASGMGKIPQDPVFNQLITALINQAAQEPRWLFITLKHLCRLQLSREQMDAAFTLLDALGRAEDRPGGEATRQELLWCLTLLHFRCHDLLDAFDSSHNPRDRLAELYRYYVEIEDSWGKTDGVVDRWSCDASHIVGQDMETKRWCLLFARDYWQHEYPQQGEGSPLRPIMPSDGNRQSVSSQLQFTIYESIKAALSQASQDGSNLSAQGIEMEVSINSFPVDILIDRRICIEVDGPSHYLKPENTSNLQSQGAPPARGDGTVSVLPPLPGERQAKDRFIDHMLEQYGYRVFRIPHTCKPGSLAFGQIIDQIKRSLADKE